MSRFIGKIIRLMQKRPGALWSSGREFLLFYLSHLIRKIIPFNSQVKIDQSVRIQRLSSILAEKPSAQIRIGKYSIIYEKAEIEAYGEGQIAIGESSIIGDALIYAREEIKIGSHFLTSWNVFIQDFDPHPINPKEREKQIDHMTQQFYPRFHDPKSTSWEGQFPTQPISIGNNVWVGANVTILKGAQIGNGCIVATGAVVTKGTYPDNSIIAGNPAKVIKQVD